MRTSAEPSEPSAEAVVAIDRVMPLAAPDDPAHADWYALYTRVHRERLAADLDIARSWLPAGGRILEYGSAPPLFTGALSSFGFTVQGIDLAPERFSRALRELNVPVARCDIETEALPFEDGFFDGVVFNEVFEHLRIDLIFTLRETLRVLKPGGTLLLSTPNLHSLRGMRNFLFRQQAGVFVTDVYGEYDKLRRLGHMGHVREYTPREVTEFLTRIGFRPMEILYRGSYPSTLGRRIARLLPKLRPNMTLKAIKP